MTEMMKAVNTSSATDLTSFLPEGITACILKQGLPDSTSMCKFAAGPSLSQRK